MSFFQKTVEQKYLKQLDAELINTKYLEFKSYFGNADIQENIRNSKEEQYQEGFLRELFVKILGYKLNPTPNFNLTTEYKNIKDSKKADGAIILRGHAPLHEHVPSVIAVIELKGTDTTDLSKIEVQAFGYKNNQPDCVYIITSNFEKIRFYIDNAIEYIELNLFTLSKTDFEILYLILSYESIKNGLPKKIKEESLSHEDVITKQLYKDYSLFKRELHQNLVLLNPQFDSLTLFKKSQKLLDRFLFLFFAEDCQLLPPNSVRLILSDWRDLQDRDVEIPLYKRFKKYFEYLNTGYKGKRYDVFAYNGGLFKPDDLLDTILIDDELLFRHTKTLSEYDFDSEIDVNILGHIFENSLNELDEINAQLSGETVDKTKTRRKKDGVFYTPKYITKYIVENTVGKLCTEKKTELLIAEEEYTTDKKRHQKTKQALLDKLKTYQNWLLQLTICDPACGSGAFLNQALDFLMKEHRYIDELQAKLLGVPLIFSDIEKSILENNLFGVDLNEESVEIAKLSLWLRTAQPNRKLNDLNNNIKCGNSLIDDPSVAGDKAFNWYEGFPQVFEKKDKKGWHITCATHNSRYSQRMLDNHVEWGDAVWLSEKEEKIVIETIAKIANEDNLNIIAFNVCGDHMHLLLVCEEHEVPKIVGKLKSISARACNIEMGRTIPGSSSPDASARERGTAQAHLWTQKFGCKEITSEEQLENTIAYIRNNRVKHGLPELGGNSNSNSNKGARPLVSTMCCSVEHAFRPEYNGGFDVVIGNPPYGILIEKEIQNYYTKHYPFTRYKTNLYVLFIERMLQIFDKGTIFFIIPKSLLFNSFYEDIRKLLITKTEINEIFTITEKVFEDAEVGGSLLMKFTIKRSFDLANIVELASAEKIQDFISMTRIVENKVPQNSFLNVPNCEISVISKDSQSVIDKISKFKTIGDFYLLKNGLNPGNIKHILVSDYKESENHKPIIWGRDISRYNINWSGQYVNYDESIIHRINIEDIKSKDGMNKQSKIDFALRSPNLFENRKIVVRKTGDSLIGCLDTDNYYFDTLVHGIYIKDKQFSLEYLLSLINSKPVTILYRLLHDIKGKVFAKISLDNLRSFPLPEGNPMINELLEEKAKFLISKSNELQETAQKFQRTIQRKFNLEELPDKLQNWHLISYSDFIKELGKKKIKLSLSDEAEWEDYFLQESQKVLAVKQQIDSTDKEIDQMVYQLYGLTDEEINIVEGE